MLKINIKSILFVLLGVVLAVGVHVYAASTYSVLLDPNSRPAKDGAKCDVASVTKVQIGNQLSTQVMATSSTRAFARIQIDNNATNTPYISFNQGASATVNNGLALGVGNTTTGVGTSTPFIDFGLATPFPYTGAVTAITNNGTTTVLVTTCNY